MAEAQKLVDTETQPIQLQILPNEDLYQPKGKFEEINAETLDLASPKRFYSHPNGGIWVGDAIQWLKSLEKESVDLIFADPPYNVQKAEWDTFESQEAYLKWSFNGMHEKTPHPTQKPEELIRKFILASSNPNSVVIDPFLGSGTTAVVSEQLKRKWKGCDNNPEYCKWAANRIELVKNLSEAEWIQYDLENERRRKSIR